MLGILRVSVGVACLFSGVAGVAGDGLGMDAGAAVDGGEDVGSAQGFFNGVGGLGVGVLVTGSFATEL